MVLTRSGKEEAHYCDSFGFTPVPEFFLQREKQLTPRELLTGESIQTPRGSFLVTDMSREQLEAAGYALHIHDELVAAAFASLPEQEQGILILHCVLGLADGEIGTLVGMSRSAVQRHRTKALNELRKRLEEERRKPK